MVWHSAVNNIYVAVIVNIVSMVISLVFRFKIKLFITDFNTF